MRVWKSVLIFVAGAAVGSVGTYFGTKKYFEAKADEEIDAMREFMRAREKKHEKEISEWKEGADGDTALIDELQGEVKTLKNIIQVNGYVPDEEGTRAKRKDEKVLAEMQAPEEPAHAEAIQKPKEGRRMIAPSEVSLVEFEDGSPAYDHTCLTYYKEDETMLYDADYEKVGDVRRLIGQAGIDALNRVLASGQEECFYIKNESFGQYYEVQVVNGSSLEAENYESGFVGEE